VSIYEGIEKLRDPHPISDFWLNYLVLGIALGLESFSAYKAAAAFDSHRGPRGWLAALRASKDAALFTVLLEDIAAVTGLLIALLALICVQVLGWEQADAAQGPLIAINEIRTMHLGPEDVLVAASVDAIDGLRAEEVEALTSRLEGAIKAEFPLVRRLFIETQSAAGHAAAIRAEKAAAKRPKAKAKAAARQKQAADPSPAAATAPTVRDEIVSAAPAAAPEGDARPPSRKAKKRAKKD
jgi:divalent metal cation (Fe/Co/Zn/Cd) transporter